VWTTDKDGIILGLLAAEMTAPKPARPSELFESLTSELGVPFYETDRRARDGLRRRIC